MRQVSGKTDFNIETLKPSWRALAKRSAEKHEPHALKAFFKTRAITNGKLAKVLNVSEASVCNWLNGKSPIPPNAEAGLWEVQAKILSWEKLHNMKFGT